MIKNWFDYIITVLAVLAIGWFYDEIKNEELGYAFYFGVPCLLYFFYYIGERSLDKLLLFLTSRNRFETLYLVPLGILIGIIGDILTIRFLNALGGATILLSLIVFFFWKKICREMEEENKITHNE